MKPLRLAALPLLLSAACAAHAQTTEIEVNDGTAGTCYRADGAAPCGFFTRPTIDAFVWDGAGKSSEITTTADATTIRTDDGATWSGLNVAAGGTALESSDASGYAAAATQTGTSSLTGLDGGQFLATGDNASNQDSSIALEGTMGLLRTRDATASNVSFYETGLTGTTMGYIENGAAVATISSNASGHQILGDTALTGALSVTGASTLNGIDNRNAGITGAGVVSGVTAGSVNAGSTEAINGAQLFTTNTAVAAAQATADTAITNAASAQATADTAITNAASAQATADTAVVNAASAQATATSAQATADTAIADAASARSTAGTANANAAAAQTTANVAMSTASFANTNALGAYNLANGLSGRVSSLEGRVQGLASDLEHVDQMAGRGIAIATALASMPDLEPGKRAGVGIGVGAYDGHNAVSAAFVVRASEHAKLRINGGTAGDGKFAFGAGGMFSW